MPRRETQRRKRFLTMNQLRERWGGISHMTVERKMEADRNFPRPIRLGPKGRTRLWDEALIEKYERACVVR
jgi:predicted DNA-binding transcriptional regulator AlpA